MVTYRQTSSGVAMSIVNESHTDRLEKYSSTGGDASVKVASDEVMAELLRLESKLGLETMPGPSPAGGAPGLLGSIEIRDARGERHAILTNASSASMKSTFVEYQVNFISLFNMIYAPQAVEADPTIFDNQRPRN